MGLFMLLGVSHWVDDRMKCFLTVLSLSVFKSLCSLWNVSQQWRWRHAMRERDWWKRNNVRNDINIAAVVIKHKTFKNWMKIQTEKASLWQEKVAQFSWGSGGPSLLNVDWEQKVFVSCLLLTNPMNSDPLLSIKTNLAIQKDLFCPFDDLITIPFGSHKFSSCLFFWVFVSAVSLLSLHFFNRGMTSTKTQTWLGQWDDQTQPPHFKGACCVWRCVAARPMGCRDIVPERWVGGVFLLLLESPQCSKPLVSGEKKNVNSVS